MASSDSSVMTGGLPERETSTSSLDPSSPSVLSRKERGRCGPEAVHAPRLPDPVAAPAAAAAADAAAAALCAAARFFFCPRLPRSGAVPSPVAGASAASSFGAVAAASRPSPLLPGTSGVGGGGGPIAGKSLGNDDEACSCACDS